MEQRRLVCFRQEETKALRWGKKRISLKFWKRKDQNIYETLKSLIRDKGDLYSF
jgi:hypothetical protein